MGVESAAFCVEGMADFVTDNRTDGAVVERVGRFGVEKWRLENGGREVQRILQRQVDGIHGLRRHRPFTTVNRSPQTRNLPVVFEQATAPQVAEEIVRLYFQAGIV